MPTVSTSPRRALGALAALALASCGQEYDVIQGPVNIDPGEVAECGFSPISGTKFSVYDCNPVFSGTGENWGDRFVSVGFRTQELLGHPFYQIWYSASPSNGGSEPEWGLGYAVSDNGTDWTPHEANPLVSNNLGDWDEDNMDGMQIIWDESRGEYVLWYQGYNITNNPADQTFGIGIKTSPDGVGWSDLRGDGMVLDLSRDVKGIGYCWPLGVSYTPGVGYSGYLAGGPSSVFGDNVCQTYRFLGKDLDDPSSFEFTDQPMLEAGPENYDAAGHASVAVVEWGEDEWYLFYVGFSDWVQASPTVVTSNNHSFNMATSSDGINWTKADSNPQPINNVQPGVVRDVAAQKYGSRILLWITDEYDGANAVGFYVYEPEIEPHP